MKRVFLDEEAFPGKELVFEENIWTGKVTISLGGYPLNKIDKKSYFVRINGVDKTLRYVGNKSSGSYLELDNKKYPVYEKQSWYIWPLIVLPFILIMVFGNIKYFAQNGFPVVGGAIGGGISGLMCALALYAVLNTKKPIFKVLIALAFSAVTVLICFLIGLVIISL